MGRHSEAFERHCAAAKASVTEITIDALQAERDRWHVLDVREDHEWAGGHIDGAEHLGRGILERDIESRYPDRSTPLVLYCGGGYRSALAARSLQDMGYTNVRSLAGGYRAWKG